MSGLRDVILGGTAQVIRPDAADNFAGSLETAAICHIRTATIQPTGEVGEAVLRRLYIQGWHKATIRMFVTPVIDGRFRNEFTVYLSRPAPVSGRFHRFSLIAPVGDQLDDDYDGFAFSGRGSAFAVHLEVRVPLARTYFTSVVPTFEPLDSPRSRGVRE